MTGQSPSQIVSALWSFFDKREWDKAQTLLAEDFIATWPQSREKMTGPNFIEVNRRYPGTHKIEVLNLQHDQEKGNRVDTVISEIFIQSQMPDGKELKLFAISFFTVENEKIKSVREYWGDCYPPPDWRKDLVDVY